MIYLYILITQVGKYLYKYLEYEVELSDFITKYTEVDKNRKSNININVPANEFESINDKIHNMSMNLIKVIGDCTNASMSYFKFRNIIEKNKLDIPFNQLPEKIREDLKEINYLRNWMFHNPESLLVAEFECFNNLIPKELQGDSEIEFNANPIIISYYEEYKMRFVMSLLNHTNIRGNMFQRIYNNMVSDYERILGEKVDVIDKKELPKEYFDYGDKAIELSWAIQKNRYKGEINK